MTRPSIRAALLATIALAAGSCSIATSDTPTVIAQDDLDDSLRREPTTTTTEAAGTSIQVDYFLLQENPDDPAQKLVYQVVVPVVVPDPERLTIVPLLEPLFADDFRTANGFEELITQVASNFDLVGVRPPEDREDPDGYHTLLLATPDPDTGLPSNDIQRDAFAQLVWTLTGRIPGVRQLRIEVDGQLRAVPTSASETPVEHPVSRCDYYAYDPEALEEPCEDRAEETSTTASTTTSSTTTTTTVALP